MKVKYKGYDLIAEKNRDKIYGAIVQEGKIVFYTWSYKKEYAINSPSDAISQMKAMIDNNDHWMANHKEFNAWLETISRRYAIIGGADGPMILKSK